MKRTMIDIRERIRVRAYYLSLKYEAASALSCWLLAERTEQQLAQRRAAGARKAAETRKAKLATTMLGEKLVATNRQQTVRQATTAH